MNIYFLQEEGIPTPFIEEDRIELYPDMSLNSSLKHGDDFGYKTTFKMKLFFKENIYDLPLSKILIENEEDTYLVFQKILNDKKNSYFQFPIEDINYISLSTDMDFYSSLYSLLNKIEIVNILTNLHDASFIKHTSVLSNLIYLFKSPGFYNSLIRDMTSKNAFEYGWLIVENRTIEKEINFELNFRLATYNNEHRIPINFRTSIFPNNVNILIGSNGSGKSQTLKHMADELLGIGNSLQINKIPVFNQIVVIAYSPFENYRTSLRDTTLTIKTSYKYFGFREENKTFNPNLPFKDSMKSIMHMLREDKQKYYFSVRPNKYDTFKDVIFSAIDFDDIGFEVTRDIDFQLHNRNKIVNKKYYIIKNKADFLSDKHLFEDYINYERGIVFFKNDTVIELSSGQQIFSHIISSIISSIREDTILLIDEPELYLHPNLEVELIDMLQKILKIYKSYAIVATHSSIFVREVAKDYISVFKKLNDNTIYISNPPFETFGGDIERINSYVFFDKDIQKPFEKWLERLTISERNNNRDAVEEYKNILNEESLILMLGIRNTSAN